MRLWAWLATRAASGWLIALLIASVGSLGWYIQSLRVDAARCKGREDVQAQVERLTQKVVQNVEKEADEAIREVRQAPDECLSERMPDALIDRLRTPPDSD